MKHLFLRRRMRQHPVAVTLAILALLAVLLFVGITPARAAPGAHGPDGEHLDGPAAVRSLSALPRLQAQSEAFELVAELRTGELVIFIDRFATNEPVLGAQLEVQSGALQAPAAFRAEQGDYVVTDAALLQALAAPGEHGLVFTLVAGQEGDLLDGTLLVAGPAGAAAHHGHDHTLEYAAWAAGALAALGLAAVIVSRRRRVRSGSSKLGGV